MNRSPRRLNATTVIEEGSPQNRVAQAFYEHDAKQATATWHPWRLATRPKRLLYLARAAIAIAVLKGSETLDGSPSKPLA